MMKSSFPASNSSSAFSGMSASAAYSVTITPEGPPAAVPFSAQSLTEGSFTFLPGSTETPSAGTLTVNQPGIYEIFYIFGSIKSSADTTLQTSVTVNGAALPRSVSDLTVTAAKACQMSHRTTAALCAGDLLQVTIQSSAAADLTVAANTSELLVNRISGII